MATGTMFARAYRADGRAIDSALVTRWERSGRGLSYGVLRRYEELLGLSPHRLITVADTIYRESRGGPGPSFLDRGCDGTSSQVRKETGELLDRVLGGEVMDADGWDRLTTYLTALPDIYVYPTSAWNDVADRLLTELIITNGSDWLRRCEALSRLMGHPQAGAAVVASCAALVRDRTNQVFIDPLSIMEASPNPAAAAHLLWQITNPVNDHALRGAWWAAAEKIGKNHFSDGQIQTLSRAALDVLGPGSVDPAVRSAAAEVLRQVPAADLNHVVRHVVGRDAVGKTVLRTGRLAEGSEVNATVARIAAVAQRRMPRDVLVEDPMLHRLVDEMLFHAQISRRFTATHLLDATPYAKPIADALHDELRQRWTLRNQPVALAMISAFGLLTDRRGRPLLEQLALSGAVSDVLAETALRTLGHVGGASFDGFWTAAMARRGQHASGARAIVYALGISRNDTALRRYRTDSAQPASARAAAAWWLNIPNHIMRSAEPATY